MGSGWSMILSISLLLVVIDGIIWLYLKDRMKNGALRILYWSLTFFFVAGAVTYQLLIKRISGPEIYPVISTIVGIILTCYLPKTAAMLLRTVLIPVTLLWPGSRKTINRSVLLLAVLLLAVCVYSFTAGRSAFRMRATEVAYREIPENLRGLKIVQLSDLHLGSLSKNFKGIEKMVRKVNETDPDLILCTGDFVNNFSEEMLPFIPQLRRLQARYGVYGVTGNHDYGLYTRWKSDDLRAADHRKLIENIEAAGIRLLNNTHIKIRIGQDTLCLAGVENWGRRPFPQFGDLNKALKDTEGYFTILMSHDPSHWRAQILQTHTDLTLSGHTHAMQMGISLGSLKWSPAEYIYEEYDGLYREKGDKYINVSRGQGYIGLPGRLGMRPAIDIITLTRKQSEQE